MQVTQAYNLVAFMQNLSTDAYISLLQISNENFISGQTRKTRIVDVVYNASNNELVRTKTLVKNAIVIIDAAPFRQWYEAHYALPLGRKKSKKLVRTELEQLLFG